MPWPYATNQTRVKELAFSCELNTALQYSIVIRLHMNFCN